MALATNIVKLSKLYNENLELSSQALQTMQSNLKSPGRALQTMNCYFGAILAVITDYAMRRSEYFPTFQCTKRVKLNLLIPLQKFKKDNFKLFLHKYRSQNMQKKLF